MNETISRRNILVAGALGLAATLPAAGAAVGGYDPRGSAEGQIKVTSTLDGSPAFWTYSCVIYALLPDQHPRAIMGASGCQTSWAAKQEDGSYRVTGATLTFFRDLETGALLDVFNNPITGQRNVAKSNFLSGASIIHPADGSSAYLGTAPTNTGVVAPGGYNQPDSAKPLGRVMWRVETESVILMTDRSWPVPVQPQLEAQSQSVAKSDFLDPNQRRIPARFTSTTIIPWMKWMDMGTTPGHLMWHSSGEKNFSLDGLDADYRAKAGPLMDKLAAKPV